MTIPLGQEIHLTCSCKNIGAHRGTSIKLIPRPQDSILWKEPKAILLGICIGCIIAKTNIHFCDVGYYVPTCFRHYCEMLDMMFQHPGTVQCALFYARLYARFILLRNPRPRILLTKQHTYLFRIRCVLIPKGVTIF